MPGHSHRTIVYIDGFNFYYGQVKGTPWKWIDPQALFGKVLGEQNNLVKVRYFTARVQPTPHDPDVNFRQDAYFRAIQAYCPLVEFHYGHFLRHKVSMENVSPPPSTVKVWKNEEKGSDVNMALHILNDAWLDAYDCAVIVSNDSDLADSLRLVKAQHKKLIGVITPGAPKRKTSKQLAVHADFIKPVRTWALESSQLPNPVPGSNIFKPTSW
ncbi:NYN domain-containing protein [Ferrovum sp.]|uniref:NYN domain-containing protein n=1 Tax=Ferrovum sp. TaxID=2609467 RepID=UPI00261EA179|nr:NYN domain-containing protein [Ferrovum sp.]